MTNDEKIQLREDRLVHRQRSYRNAYVGAVFLCIISFFVFAVVIFTKSNTRNPELLKALFAQIWLFLAVSAYARTKLDHISTIQHYRALIAVPCV